MPWVPNRTPSELEEQKRLGALLREHRKRSGLSQRQIADALECQILLVQRLERGEALLTIPRLIRLAEAFHIDPTDLLHEVSPFEAHEDLRRPVRLTDEERRLLEAFHRIEDRVQRHNVLALIERMTP